MIAVDLIPGPMEPLRFIHGKRVRRILILREKQSMHGIAALKNGNFIFHFFHSCCNIIDDVGTVRLCHLDQILLRGVHALFHEETYDHGDRKQRCDDIRGIHLPGHLFPYLGFRALHHFTQTPSIFRL